MLFRFKTADLAPLVEHARAATQWKTVYGQNAAPFPALFLVKDEGAYLMSNGIPHLPREGGGPESSHVVYADGCSPAHGHIGGDDWVEQFSLSDLAPFLACEEIEFVVTADTIDLRGLGGAPAKKPKKPKAKK